MRNAFTFKAHLQTKRTFGLQMKKGRLWACAIAPLPSLLPSPHIGTAESEERVQSWRGRGPEWLGAHEYSRRISPLTNISNVAFLERIQFVLISFYSKLYVNGHESAVKVGKPRDETDRLRPVQSSSTFMSIDQKHDISYAEEIRR